MSLLLPSTSSADARSSEAFVALCLLTIAGTSLAMQHLDFSDMWQTYYSVILLLVSGFCTRIRRRICTHLVTREQLKMPMHFLLSGLKDFFSISIESSTLLEKAMQGTMFLSCLKLFMRETRESRIQC
ncbi:uncharacterized protein [Arachis hypogaea]|uniref:uncharacterized protein n=1 Tax=Arachis hypogaea TaxID=3818 RepID=UPI003B2198DB